MNISAKGIIILILLLIASIGLNIYQWNRPEIEKKIEIVKKDTIVDWKYSTDTVYFSKIKYKDRIVYDTIHKNDVVYIRDSAVVHRDSTADYTIDISAVRLDWYKLDINHRDTVTVTNTITTIVKEKRKPLGLSIFAGPSYDPINKSFGLSVGAGITFNFNK
jgi:hypothetical protein